MDRQSRLQAKEGGAALLHPDSLFFLAKIPYFLVQLEELQACVSPGGGADVWKLKLDFADFISEKSHFSDHLKH